MRALLLVALAVAVLLLAPSALADPDPPVQPVPADAAAEPAGEDLGGVVDLEEGQPAPYDGFLLSEQRYLAAAELQVKLDMMAGYLSNREQQIAELAGQLSSARVASDPGWWSRHGFTVGVIVGAASTVAVIWAAMGAARE